MNGDPAASSGVIGTLRALGDGLLASVQDRVALLGIELEEEKVRLIQILMWSSAAIVTGVVALVMTSFALIYFFWEVARTAVVVGLVVFHVGLFGGTVIALRRMLARQPRPLAASLAEVTEDRRCIRGDN